MPLAPDTDNYMKAGKGKVYFEPTGETGHLHLGNIPKLELTPEIEKDEHFSSMESTLEADESWVIKKSLKGSVDLEEASPDNTGWWKAASLPGTWTQYPRRPLMTGLWTWSIPTCPS